MRVFLQKVLALLSQIKPFLRSSCLRIFVALQANQRKIRKRRIFYGGFIMEKEQCKSFIKRITLDEFNNLIKNKCVEAESIPNSISKLEHSCSTFILYLKKLCFSKK